MSLKDPILGLDQQCDTVKSQPTNSQNGIDQPKQVNASYLDRCSVPQCNTYKGPDTPLFTIPKYVQNNTEELNKWANVLKMGDDFPNNFRICLNHFDPKTILIPVTNDVAGRPLLVKGALPCLNLPTTLNTSNDSKRVIVIKKIKRCPSTIKYKRPVLERSTQPIKRLEKSKPPEPEIAFEHIEIKQEPNTLISNDVITAIEPSTCFSTCDIVLPCSEATNPTGSVPLTRPCEDVKRKLVLKDDFIVPPVKTYKKGPSKPVMKNQACQIDFIQDYSKDDFKDNVIAKLKQENERLKIRLTEHQNITNEQNHFGKIPIESLRGKDKKIQHLIWFPNFSTMETVYKDVKSDLPCVVSCRMFKFDVFFMTLMQLKLDLSLFYISLIMNVSTATLSKLFYETFNVLYGKLRDYIVWPNESSKPELNPDLFQAMFGNRRLIIVDSFELYPERNRDRSKRFQTPLLTGRFKYLISFSILGRVIFLSKPFGAEHKNRSMAEQSGFYNLIKMNDIVLGDYSFASATAMNVKPQVNNTYIIPLIKNTEGELIVNSLKITTQMFRDIERRIYSIKSGIMVMSDRSPSGAGTTKYDKEMYTDFLVKMGCVINNLMLPNPEPLIKVEQLEQSD